MSTMTREQKDMANLGLIGIMRESFRQFWTHFGHFLLIQLTLILPVVMLFGAIQNMFLEHQAKKIIPSPSPPSPAVPHGLLRLSNDRSSFQSVSSRDPFDPIVLLSLCAAFAFQAAQGLSTSAILLSVGFVYTGQTLSFVDVLGAAVPRLWARLTFTTLYNVLLLYSVTLLETVGLLLLLKFQADHIWVNNVFKIVVTGASELFQICLGIIFSVASGVSVLEEECGWSSFVKARQLLEGKRMVAIWFHVVWSWTVPSVITHALNHRVEQIGGGRNDYRIWIPTPLLFGYVNAFLFVAWMSLFWQLSSLCAGVQYVSFKAYHNESIADSPFFEERAKRGHGSVVGDEIVRPDHDASIKDQPPDSALSNC